MRTTGSTSPGRWPLIACAVLLLGGCNVVYKQNITQGNVLEREDIERLEAGMTKRQVRVLLGSPAINSPFHSDRWDYVNSFARRGGKAERRTLTVLFEDDRVVDFSGNYLETAKVAGEELEQLEIIDPSTNRPVLPPSEIDGEPVPEPVSDPIPDPQDPDGD
jgi:outer membrane protein assembly factor BamE